MRHQFKLFVNFFARPVERPSSSVNLPVCLASHDLLSWMLSFSRLVVVLTIDSTIDRP